MENESLGKGYIFQFLHSVSSTKANFNSEDIKCNDLKLTNLDTSRVVIYEILNDLDIRKSRSPTGHRVVLFQKNVKLMSKTRHKSVSMKLLGKILDCWKLAALTLVYKEDDKRLVENYYPGSLLNIDSKLLESEIYKALYRHSKIPVCESTRFCKEKSQF